MQSRCPPTDELADGPITGRRREAIARHVRDCPACRAATDASRAGSCDGHELALAERSLGITPRFAVRSVAGEGGYGAVVRAYDRELGRDVALKVFHRTGADPQAEGKALAELRHPNVVEVFDVVRSGGRAVLVMEFVEGGTAQQWLAKRRTPREILEVFVAAGAGLAALHRCGLVHCDVKPSNILISAAGRVKVADLGACRRSAQAGPVAAAGTLAYMAPEQVAGGTVDARADQFAFCVALYEALWGRRPFDPDGAPRVSVVGGPTQRVIARGLDPDPERRWPSMDALLDRLGAAQRRGRRQRWALVVGAAAVVITVAAYLAAGGVVASSSVSAPQASLEAVARGPADAPEAISRLITEAGQAYQDERFAQAEGLALQAAAHAAAVGQPRSQATAWLWVGRARLVRGAPEAAITTALQDAGWGALGCGEADVAAVALSQLMVLASMEGELDEVERLTRVVRRLQADEQLGDRARALVHLAFAKRSVNEAAWDAARDSAELALRFAGGLPSASVEREVRRIQAMIQLGTGDAAGAEAALRGLLADKGSTSSVHWALARALEEQGRVDEARGHFEAAIDGYTRVGNVPGAVGASVVYGQALTTAGDLDHAHAILTQAQRHADEGLAPHHAHRFALHSALAELAVGRADLVAAQRHIERALSLARRAYGSESEHVGRLEAHLCWIDRKLGQSALARRHCRESLRVAELGGDALTLSRAHRSMGWLDVAESDLDAAHESFSASLRAAQSDPRASAETRYAREGLAEVRALTRRKKPPE